MNRAMNKEIMKKTKLKNHFLKNGTEENRKKYTNKEAFVYRY